MTRVERRGFIVGTLSLLAAPLAADAQQAGNIRRIGFLTAVPLSVIVGPHRGIPAGPARAGVRGGKNHRH
jgi:hypothetical protein